MKLFDRLFGRRPTVLISEPHAIETPAPFAPYVWAILKSHWERNGDPKAFEWLDPIFENAEPEQLLAPYRGRRIDVLGLSCYTWNWALQCDLARRVKEGSPECLVVAGGPEPDFADPAFFDEYPYIDVVAVKDGEITFTGILDRVSRGESDFTDVGGLHLSPRFLAATESGRSEPGHSELGGGSRRPVSTGPAVVPTVFDYSPYIEQREYYERLFARFPPGGLHATWETNRGCPYACSFCDWGSNTRSKVRRFSMERIAAEVDWLASMKVSMIFSADANFGILARDLEIADLMNAARREHGYPHYLYYSAAKNHPERAIEIASKFSETGICPTHTLAIQHTDPEVLAATDRANISPTKQVEAAKALMHGEIPIDVQLIVGIPGDTPERWSACLTDLMEWGIHEEYYTFFYHLLPNAPAAEPAFLEAWSVGTIDRLTLSDPRQPLEKGEQALERLTSSRLIVESKSYSRSDWVEMNTRATLTKALHNTSLTRLIAIYLRLTHGVPYDHFYDGLLGEHFERDPKASTWRERIRSHYTRFVDDASVTDHLEVASLPSMSFLLDPSRWLFVEICREIDAFFEELGTFLCGRYPTITNLPSVIDYQRQMVILPDYDRSVGKSFPTDLDWISYFAAARGRTGEERLDEPLVVSGAHVVVSDETCGEATYLVHPLDWGDGSDEERWVEWVRHTVVQRNSAAKNNFQSLRLERSGLAAGAG